MNELFFGIGILGFFGMSWLFPVLARAVFQRSEPRPRAAVAPPMRRLRMALIIPAHNEDANLRVTLPSLVASVRRAEAVARYLAKLDLTVSIHVVADGCTDQTVTVAQFLGANVHLIPRKSGKWAALNACVRTLERSAAIPDWYGFVDAGVQWEEAFFARVVSEIYSHPEAMAVAPTYLAPQSGRIGHALWEMERRLKDLESQCGGPVSVHGATVFYRRRELVTGLNFLSKRPGPGISWLNDDVVLPLSLRALFPESMLLYLADAGVSDPATGVKSEFNRRRRMVLGNLQWMRGLFPQVTHGNQVAAILALRRVARMLWAYWALFFAAGLFGWLLASLFDFDSGLIAPMLTLAGGLVLTTPFSISPYLDAARASILAPYYFLAVADVRGFGQNGAWR